MINAEKDNLAHLLLYSKVIQASDLILAQNHHEQFLLLKEKTVESMRGGKFGILTFWSVVFWQQQWRWTAGRIGFCRF